MRVPAATGHMRTACSLVGVVLFSLASAAPPPPPPQQCACLTELPAYLPRDANGNVLTRDFTALSPSYGVGSCDEHDMTTEGCSGVSPPEWCSQSWCYVAPDCTASDLTQTSVFAAHGRRLLSYSYSNCGGRDVYVGAGHPCTCLSSLPSSITRADDGTVTTSSGEKLPASYGTGCSRWDEQMNPSCRHLAEDVLPSWCFQPWCYVQSGCVATHSVEDVKSSFLFPEAGDTGPGPT